MVLASNELTSILNETSGALGYFLLSQEKTFKNEYLNGFKKIDEVMNELYRLTQSESVDAEVKELLSLIKTDITTFAS